MYHRSPGGFGAAVVLNFAAVVDWRPELLKTLKVCSFVVIGVNLVICLVCSYGGTLAVMELNEVIKGASRGGAGAEGEYDEFYVVVSAVVQLIGGLPLLMAVFNQLILHKELFLCFEMLKKEALLLRKRSFQLI